MNVFNQYSPIFKSFVIITMYIVFNSYGTKIQAQICNLHTIEQDSSTFDNIKVEKLYSDSLVSTFVIWVKKEVRLHKHLYHTEQVRILDGAALMTLGNDSLFVQKDDWIFIPKNTPHSVIKVYGERPLKVISIQAPFFDGTDRVFLDVEEK